MNGGAKIIVQIFEHFLHLANPDHAIELNKLWDNIWDNVQRLSPKLAAIVFDDAGHTYELFQGLFPHTTFKTQDIVQVQAKEMAGVVEKPFTHATDLLYAVNVDAEKITKTKRGM